MIKQETHYDDHLMKDEHDVKLNDDLRPLWLACYYEKRLSKNMIQAVHLKHTIRVLKELGESGSDFRKVYPFVFGFIKILLRKFNFLISESNSTLESLKNPFATDDVEEVQPSATKRKNAAKRDGAFVAP
jgi:hypothetical protein